MPRGRKPNLDKKITDLISQLKRALIARETTKIEATVTQQISGLLGSIQAGAGTGDAPLPRIIESITISEAPAPAKKGKKKPRSAASRALQAKRMKAYWAKRKAKEAKVTSKGGRRAKAAAALISKTAKGGKP